MIVIYCCLEKNKFITFTLIIFGTAQVLVNLSGFFQPCSSCSQMIPLIMFFFQKIATSHFARKTYDQNYKSQMEGYFSSMLFCAFIHCEKCRNFHAGKSVEITVFFAVINTLTLTIFTCTNWLLFDIAKQKVFLFGIIYS